MKSFDALTEKEVLALAISLEEEDERVYADSFGGAAGGIGWGAGVCYGDFDWEFMTAVVGPQSSVVS